MTSHSTPSIPLAGNPARAVFRAYTALASVSVLDAETGLGGTLLYAGEITESSCELLFAANIAGAASLAASADPAVLRQVIRDGAVDFSVTSLEEALRILKNEIRKRLPVSAAVGLDPRILVEQMLDRGVLPDLLRIQSHEQVSVFLNQGARAIVDSAVAVEVGELVTWSVGREFNRWLPKLDACVQAVIPPDDHLRQRWLRLSPRYLGRMAQREHGVALSSKETARVRIKAKEMLQQHPEVMEQVEIQGHRLV